MYKPWIGGIEFDKPSLQHIDAFQREIDAKIKAFSQQLKDEEAAGQSGMSPNCRKLLEEIATLKSLYDEEFQKLQEAVGITDEMLAAVENASMPITEDKFWRKEIESTDTTEHLDGFTENGYEHLMSTVDQGWLRKQGQRPFRLGDRFRTEPLQIISGLRIVDGVPAFSSGPQRFARMLLVCRDHLEKRDDLDFFSAAIMVPEVAALGRSLREIRELGPAAASRLARLGQISDEEVAAAVYELLVGSRCVRKALKLEMLAPDRTRRFPDYRIHSLGVPACLECKRRLSVTKYELREAAQIEKLYSGIRDCLADAHLSIGATFSREVFSVDPSTFREDVQSAIKSLSTERHTNWGQIRAELLPYTVDLPGTRLYSPDYLERVYGWTPWQVEWDGLLCEVDQPDLIMTSRAKNPRCLKWTSTGETAVLKKSRGITSLWADATKQIPAGELGIIYIAYPETGRTDIADARTRHIMEATQHWRHRWSINVALTMINRLYPRALNHGAPDLIESSIPAVEDTGTHLLARFPTCVFVEPPK